MRAVLFMPAAQLEATEAQDWYEREASGLGARFRAELDRASLRRADNPLQFPLVAAGTRRALLRRFPYALYFQEHDESIFMLACFHSSRDPIIWRRRDTGIE